MKCRYCNAVVTTLFLDLGNSPPSNSFILEENLNEREVFYPLKVYVCGECFLVQIEEYKRATDIFDNFYPYFSSYSKMWLSHAKAYVEDMCEMHGVTRDTKVVEIASNDGYLLQYFVKKGIQVLGIEPTGNTAQVAMDKGIPTVVDFFTSKLAKELVEAGKEPALLLGNNVLAHVPDINDFVRGLKILLNDKGIITLEFPHVLQLVQFVQFDTIYHEHFSYFSLFTVDNIFKKHGLTVYDVQEISTHGGSLRIFAKHSENNEINLEDRVQLLLDKEIQSGVNTLTYYQDFRTKVLKLKLDFLEFLVEQKKQGKKIVAYGAAAKGNTLLNFYGVKEDFITFTVDASPAKQGKFMPGSKIPIVAEGELRKHKPDYVVILPWNIKEEIVEQLEYIRNWNGKFVLPIPELKIF